MLLGWAGQDFFKIRARALFYFEDSTAANTKLQPFLSGVSLQVTVVAVPTVWPTVTLQLQSPSDHVYKQMIAWLYTDICVCVIDMFIYGTKTEIREGAVSLSQ